MYKGKRVLGVITARGGSKGIPKKNIIEVAGKPLIFWTILAAQQSRYLTRTIVSTDDSEIAEVARRYNAEVPFVRPKELADDDARSIDVVKHALLWVEHDEGREYDIIVLLQPTSPCRLASDIDNGVRKLADEGVSSVVSVYRIRRPHPSRIKRLEGDVLRPYCIAEEEGLPRQRLDEAYARNGALYVFTRDLLMERDTLYGDSPRAIVMPIERSCEIDDPVDVVVCEYYLERLIKTERER